MRTEDINIFSFGNFRKKIRMKMVLEMPQAKRSLTRIHRAKCHGGIFDIPPPLRLNVTVRGCKDTKHKEN
jgi:hypothetical protein